VILLLFVNVTMSAFSTSSLSSWFIPLITQISKPRSSSSRHRNPEDLQSPLSERHISRRIAAAAEVTWQWLHHGLNVYIAFSHSRPRCSVWGFVTLRWAIVKATPSIA
jgi:hypothetical protein